MSAGTDPIETAGSPAKAWQYIAIILLAAFALFFAWLFLSGVELWHHTPQKPIPPRVDITSPGAFRGRPDEIEQATFKPTSGPPSRQAPPPDEAAAFNAPIMGNPQGGGQQRQPMDRQAEPQESMAQATPSGGSLLLPTAFAYRIPHPLLTIVKGTNIPCADVTVIDTGAGGNVLVKATVYSEVPGEGGKVTLLDKGSELLGEVGHAMVDGLDRIGIVWREAKTPYPNSIRVSLNSPAVGPLGEGGLDGDINRHEWTKIKGVALFTLIQGATNILQSALASHGTTSINFGNVNSSGQEIGSILLSKMLQIPDTIHRDQGLTCQAFTAGDMDFSKVYKLTVTR